MSYHSIEFEQTECPKCSKHSIPFKKDLNVLIDGDHNFSGPNRAELKELIRKILLK